MEVTYDADVDILSIVLDVRDAKESMEIFLESWWTSTTRSGSSPSRFLTRRT